MEKVININTNNKLFYRQYLELISNFPPINKLRTKELDLLALLMYEWDDKSNIDEESRMYVILNKDTKKDIANELEVTPDNINTLLYSMRKNGVLNKDNEPILALRLGISSNFVLKFNFIIK